MRHINYYLIEPRPEATTHFYACGDCRPALGTGSDQQKRIRPVALAPSLETVKAVAAVAQHLAGLAHIAELFGQPGWLPGWLRSGISSAGSAIIDDRVFREQATEGASNLPYAIPDLRVSACSNDHRGHDGRLVCAGIEGSFFERGKMTNCARARLISSWSRFSLD